MFSKKIKGRARLHNYVLSGVWSITTLIGKNFSSLAFHRARVACYSSRKHEWKLNLNNAKKIHNCADYFQLDLIHHSSQNWYILRISRFLPQSRVHRKERGLTILPIPYTDLPQSESNLKYDLGTTLPFHMLYAGTPVNANKRSC